MGLVMVFTVSEYLVTICYSPAAFTYADELSHWRTTVNILHTGKLFTANYVLPISPHYPGLEVLTSALVSVTGLSVFACRADHRRESPTCCSSACCTCST